MLNASDDMNHTAVEDISEPRKEVVSDGEVEKQSMTEKGWLFFGHLQAALSY
jgi:hypothetical protein